jgi:hypothetical protein
VKKDKVRVPRGRKSEKSDALRKQTGTGPPQPAGDALTCNEAQAEDILSEGEST